MFLPISPYEYSGLVSSMKEKFSFLVLIWKWGGLATHGVGWSPWRGGLAPHGVGWPPCHLRLKLIVPVLGFTFTYVLAPQFQALA